eukprot:gnl/Chilomastix_cuspidata/3791.p4 GENE.gnl/Chilomastix_cuspidata/3791~~gnl/Chilomastix_cuspidata/3791.p4  ORF type:complete len:120 (+),score=16.71 gnl/Chilomastix_cuspidata/3791:1420-1779(+)
MSCTLYIKNLNDKISKTLLRESLFQRFSYFGQVLDVITKRGKMRGQAHIVFCDQKSAADALSELQGAIMFKKPMVIEFARTKSFATVVREGGVPTPAPAAAAADEATDEAAGEVMGEAE